MRGISLYDYDLSREEWEGLIDSYIFSERDRELLKRRLLDGIVYEKLGEEFGITDVQAKRIVKDKSQHLFKHL